MAQVSVSVGSSVGRVQFSAADQYVALGEPTQTPTGPQPGPNPQGNAEAAVNKDVELVQINFKSIHKNLMWKPEFNGSRAYLIKTGDPEPSPEWVPGKANAKMLHTAGKNGGTIKIQIELTLNVDNAVAKDTPYVIKGTSGETALCFSGNGKISPGNGVTITLTADTAIGQKIRKIEDKIAWTITLNNGKPIDLGTSGAHVIYTTLDKPIVDPNVNSTKPTSFRMEAAVWAMSAATTAANSYDDTLAIVKAMNSFLADYYYLDRSLNAAFYTQDSDTEVWLFQEVSTTAGAQKYDTSTLWPQQRTYKGRKYGTDCLSTLKFMRNVNAAMGLKVSMDIKLYVALYCTKASPKRSLKAVEGDWFANRVNATPASYAKYGEAANKAGLKPDWFLQLADDSCFKYKNPAKPVDTEIDPNVKPGQIGCGPYGFNNFQAVGIVTDSGKTWYAIGGEKLFTQNLDEAVTHFKTLAWVDVDFMMGKNVTLVKDVEWDY
jgi:hypothetical protein